MSKMGDKMESTWLKKQPTVCQHLPKIVPKSSSGGGFKRFGRVWGDVGASLSILGASWERLGASWSHLGAVLGASLAVLGRLGGVWKRLGGVLGRLELDFHKIPSRIPFCTRCVTDFA